MILLLKMLRLSRSILLLILTGFYSLVFSVETSSILTNKTLKSITELKWQHRIILIKEDISCDQHIKSLINAKLEINDRHILWFLICNNKLETNYAGTVDSDFVNNISNKFFVNNNDKVILIGKDGGVKRRTESLNLIGLFALIDTMPMRQSEMRR